MQSLTTQRPLTLSPYAIVSFALTSILIILNANPLQAARSYRMTYEFTPTNWHSNGSYIPIPKLWDGQGVVDAQFLSLAPDSGFLLNERSGNEVAAWMLGEAEYNTKLSVSFDVELAPINSQFDPNGIWGPYRTDTEDYYFNTKSAAWAQADDPRIQDHAALIVGTISNPYKKAETIYNWVRDNIDFKSGVKQDAVTALTQREGDCGSYANLFVALCRAQGIPARNVSGFLPKDHNGTYESFTEGSWNWGDIDIGFSGHVWAEFMLPDEIWVQVDPQGQHFGDLPYEVLITSKGNEILLGNYEASWFTLPVGWCQWEVNSVKLTINFLGTSGIEHPVTPTPSSAKIVAPITILLLE
jgi:hypothetical protein